MKMKKYLFGMGVIGLLIAPSAMADVGGNKLCMLGNTCNLKGRQGKVTYHIKPSDGTTFICYIKGKGKHHFEGKLRGKDGFSFPAHDVIVHKNFIRFDVNGKFDDTANGGSMVLEKQQISIFLRKNGDAEIKCDKAF